MKSDMQSPSFPDKTGSDLMRSNSFQIADHSVKSSRFVSRSKAFSRAAAVLVMLVGALAMIGWLVDVAWLKSIYGDITMKANTALALILMGASLWSLQGADHKSSRRLGKICAAVAGLIGLLTLTEHVIGWNLHIDQLLFTEPPGALATTSPGRMGITASSCFTMFGIAMLLLYRRQAVSLAQVLSIASGFWALLAIIGYAYGAQALFGIARYTGIALPTSIALFVLCLGILGVCIDGGMLSVVSGETTAAIMARRLAVVAVCVPLVLGWVRLAGQRAGYFDLGFGTALSVSAGIMIFLVAIWRAAVRLQQVEQQYLATEAKFERAKALLAGIVESSHDAIISKTLDGVINSWNGAAERLFEYTAAEAVGQPITIIIPPERLNEERLILEKLRNGERLDHFDTVRITKSGVFDRFKQADGSITRKYGGLGLGLAIARHLTEMHGGTIEVDSAGEGLGAKFKISLPVTATAALNSARSAAVAELTPAKNVPDLHGIRVLVVDDAADTREMLRVVLEQFGADVTTAASARETLDVLPAWQPNVLVSDIGMPDEDGYSLIRKVRALSSENGGDIPAIALTGYVRVEERMHALDAGYHMFVPKPVEVGELATIIASVIGRVEKSQAAAH